MNYFPSRFGPVRHAERYPANPAQLSGRRERRMIPKENNFKQARRGCLFGSALRSWPTALLCPSSVRSPGQETVCAHVVPS